MTIAIQGRSVTFTAVNEGITFDQMHEVLAVTFQGTGLTAGQRVTLRDTATPGTGNVLADYVTEAAIDNQDLWSGRPAQIVKALALDNNTVAGTWVLTVTIGI